MLVSQVGCKIDTEFIVHVSSYVSFDSCGTDRC
jgi:hypothetical protein